MILWGCSQPDATQSLISISITADHKTIPVDIPSGSTVLQVLSAAGIKIGELDEVEPGLYTTLVAGSQIEVTRVTEDEYIEQVILPFDYQELGNDALPAGEMRLSQPGENGLREITHRRLYKDGIEVSDSIIKTAITKDPISEIVMVGTQSMFAALPIPGKIAYLSAGNAWVIENNTGNSQLVVSTGDLDGRIFTLSPDGNYLLYSRFSKAAKTINTLWVANLASQPYQLIDLGIADIVHFAALNLSSNRIAFSTAEWREAAPGWQANNDLLMMEIGPNGDISTPTTILKTNAGGVYGWWGAEFAWSPDQEHFLWSRPDGLGILDIGQQSQTSILDVVPFQTGANWAWVPGVAWSPAGNEIYTVSHLVVKAANKDNLDRFNIVAVPLSGDLPVTLVENTGMFAYPVPSPVMQLQYLVDPVSGKSTEQQDFSVAYLQAADPERSESSLYRLNIIDQDGTNIRAVFPDADAVGLEPQRVAWSPARLGAEGNFGIVLVYNGNVWIIDTITGKSYQVTGDGLTTRVDWR